MEGKSTSQDLLELEHKNQSSSSAINSTLLVSKEKKNKKKEYPSKPTIAPLPKSQVLDKVKGFLGIMAEANKRLEEQSKGNSQAFDIEALTGNETQVIEMDLMLGVTDLLTPQAVSAAEVAMAGISIPIETADSSSDDDGDEERIQNRTNIIELS